MSRAICSGSTSSSLSFLHAVTRSSRPGKSAAAKSSWPPVVAQQPAVSSMTLGWDVLACLTQSVHENFLNSLLHRLLLPGYAAADMLQTRGDGVEHVGRGGGVIAENGWFKTACIGCPKLA